MGILDRFENGVERVVNNAFAKAFNFKNPAFTPARMVYRPWPPDAYHVNLKEADDDT